MSTNGEMFFGESGEENRKSYVIESLRWQDGGEEAVGSNRGDAVSRASALKHEWALGETMRTRMKRRTVAGVHGAEML